MEDKIENVEGNKIMNKKTKHDKRKIMLERINEAIVKS